MVMFGLFGALFVLTQFLQFDLGYTALQTGIRLLPAAGSIILVAPFTSLLDRAFGAKLVVGAGLLLIAGWLWEISGATVATTYVGTLAGMIMLGVGAAPARATGTRKAARIRPASAKRSDDPPGITPPTADAGRASAWQR